MCLPSSLKFLFYGLSCCGTEKQASNRKRFCKTSPVDSFTAVTKGLIKVVDTSYEGCL